MGRAWICPYCHVSLTKEQPYEEHKGRHYHQECFKKVKEKEDLHEYICKIFHLKAPGPRNFAMINNYVNDKGYTYVGILQSLKFFYEIQGHTIDKANGSIGIVPYVYEQAQDYFNNKEKRQDQIAKAITKSLEQTSEKVITVQKKKKEKKIYNLDNL